MESAQQQFQLPDVQRSRRTAAKINRRRYYIQEIIELARRTGDRRSLVLFELAQERLTKSRRLRAIQQILVKRAIGTNTCAEGDVNVDVANCITLCHSERSRGIPRQNLAVAERVPSTLLRTTVSPAVVIPAVTHKIRLPSPLSC